MKEAHAHYHLSQGHVLHSVSCLSCADIGHSVGRKRVAVGLTAFWPPHPAQNFYSILSMLRMGLLRDLISLHPFESIYSRACRFFQTERLRRVFTFASM